MYDQAVDGNLAALAKYEAEVDRVEEAIESITNDKDFNILIDKIVEAVEELHDRYDTHWGYDFKDQIDELIKDAL